MRRPMTDPGSMPFAVTASAGSFCRLMRISGLFQAASRLDHACPLVERSFVHKQTLNLTMRGVGGFRSYK